LVECGHGDEFDMMHVCIPFFGAERFCEDVSYYMKVYPSRHIIIYSTVLPGTCEKLGENVVHSPVEGRHPNLIDGFKTFTRLVGGKCAKEVGDFYKKNGLNVETFEDAKVTELGKILSTTRYGLNILFAAEEEALCKRFGLKFEEVVLGYQKMYNEGYKKLGEERFVQQTLTPPVGKIGGHCVVPNAKLLEEISESELIKLLAKFNLGK
jgi:UDP-N-acetyl-D-mannosaminuronate dehydrogenase